MARALSESESGGPGIVVLHWTPTCAGLLDELARTMAGSEVGRVTCLGQRPAPGEPEVGGLDVRYVEFDHADGEETFESVLRDVRIAAARSVIVLPPSGIDDPDSSSRLACAAIRRVCGEGMPNVLVEVEDPEAAFEFAGLGVATVFYSGHLRAALLGQACVDLGVFQFVIGLLRGRHRVRSMPVPEALREATFAEAALQLEADEAGRPMTIIGVVQAVEGSRMVPRVMVNPGPRTSLAHVVALMALTSHESSQEAAQ